MSVNVEAELIKPVSLAAVLERAADALRTLLGPGVPAPEFEVFDGWRVQDRPQSPPARRMSAADLAAATIGERISEGGEFAVSDAFEFDLVGFDDRARLIVHDLTGPEDAGPWGEASVSPMRTCVGVVLATAVALGVASASGGRFIDVEIGMLDKFTWEPARFIESARLAHGAGSFDERCEQFMRQFPSLNGWPKDRAAS